VDAHLDKTVSVSQVHKHSFDLRYSKSFVIVLAFFDGIEFSFDTSGPPERNKPQPK